MTDLRSRMALHFGFPQVNERGAFGLAEAHLENAIAGQSVLWNVAMAHRGILLAIAMNEHKTEAFDPEQLCELSSMVMPVLMHVAPTDEAKAAFAAGARAARGLLRDIASRVGGDGTEDGGSLIDGLDHIALFADELDALHRRLAIASRGAALASRLAIPAAAAVLPDHHRLQ